MQGQADDREQSSAMRAEGVHSWLERCWCREQRKAARRSRAAGREDRGCRIASARGSSDWEGVGREQRTGMGHARKEQGRCAARVEGGAVRIVRGHGKKCS